MVGIRAPGSLVVSTTRGVRGWLLEELEKGRRGFLHALPKHHALGIAEHVDFAGRERGGEGGRLHHGMDRGHVNPLARWRRWVCPRGHPLTDRLSEVIGDLCRRALLEAGARKIPVEIRVGASEGVPAMLAASAGSRLRAVAEQALAKPEGESLLADAQRAMQQEGRRQGVAVDRVVEPRPERVVAMDREQGHPTIYRGGEPARGSPTDRSAQFLTLIS
jgi:hypothetical protein